MNLLIWPSKIIWKNNLSKLDFNSTKFFEIYLFKKLLSEIYHKSYRYFIFCLNEYLIKQFM